MKSLILAEKPSVGKDIAKALNITTSRNGYFENNNYIVTWALGHLVTNATPEQYDKNYKEWKLADLPIIPNKMKTVVINKTKKQFQTVQRLLQKDEVQNIIIATDAGREGELVARLILDKVHNKKPIKRLWISSVTKKAIVDGFKKLKDGRQFNQLYAAALARSEADWVVGINATRALTTKYDAQLSLGRVQTPTIKLVEMRQTEINDFTPETYYTLNINVDGLLCQCITPQQATNKEVYEKIVTNIKGQSAKVNSINRKSKKAFPPKLFNLTDLQQEAYKRYKFGPKETLNTLQQLYERHKLATYPRTDANYLTDDMVSTIKDRLRALMATDYKSFAKAQMSHTYSANDSFINNNKVSDHHAIIPTEVRPDMEALSPKEQKYKHDNLTATECPTCGKFMLKVNTKNGSMLVCQDPNCKTKKNVQSKTNARCPNCHKKMTRFGTGKDATYRCVCGHTESQAQMDKRHKNKKNDKVSKKDMKKYLNKDDGLENNPFQDALKGLKF
ncbi:DNA topoisomerase [Staphylococcus kloosii]|uniref:DNA topoisomerase n=1 Tax=Staphylococcus kloosii TaxID=29384 RepID=UPI00189CDE56|nr:DNA topoisomerase [Staphylococcus kloosii]MBF7021444.1 hypothetical protein [Staphylococcus kloosii]